MKYYKTFLGIFIFIIFLIYTFLKLIYSTEKFNVSEKDLKISTNTVSIVFEFVSLKDSVNKIKFHFKEKKQRFFISPEYVLVLKKGQKYKNEYCINVSNFKTYKQLPFYVLIEEILPNKKIKYIKIWDKKQTEKIAKLISIKEIETSPQTTQEVISSTITPKKELEKPQVWISSKPTEKKEEKITIYKEKPNFEIYISTEELKNKYTFSETINFLYYIINKNKSLSHSIELNILLKDNFNNIISTQNYKFSVLPNQINERFIQIEIPKNIIPGEYYIETISIVGDKKDIQTTGKFFISDLPPKINLTETPSIKYNKTNTILIEAEDDRGIKNIDFFEIEPKTNQEKKYSMFLIAGDKKSGLYSYTTQKINYKGIYKFYIQAEDIDGNIVKTDIYEIEIVK